MAKPKAKSQAKPRAPRKPKAEALPVQAIIEGADAEIPAEQPEAAAEPAEQEAANDAAPAEPAGDIPEGMEEVENILPGTTLSLGDGRAILFGEKANVGSDIADYLRGRGQAR